MNIKRKNSGQRDASAVNIEVDKVINSHSDAVMRAVAAVNKGQTVTLTPRHPRAGDHLKTTAFKTAIPKEELHHLNLSFGDVATALGGGAALGLGSLALAPASAIAAGIATIVGVVLSGLATKKLDKQET